MRIFRKKKKETDNGRRISWTQPKNGMGGSILVNGEVFKGDYKNRQTDFDEVYQDVKNFLKDKEGNKKRSFYYKPGERLVFSGNTRGAKDNSGRFATFMYKDSKKGKSAKEMYRDFLRDSESGLRANGFPQGTIDKELREAIKREIRKQHKIKKIKNISKVALPVLAASTTLGIVMRNKNRDK